MTGQLISHVGEEIEAAKPSKKYITGRFVEEMSEEIRTESIMLFNTHTLIKALAKDYVREIQSRLILKPVKERLCDILDETFLEKKLLNILSKIQMECP